MSTEWKKSGDEFKINKSGARQCAHKKSREESWSYAKQEEAVMKALEPSHALLPCDRVLQRRN